MSYDISVYDRSFLKRAIENSLGDWRGAPPFEPAVNDAVITKSIAVGFRPVLMDEGFAAFLRAHGDVPPQELKIETDDYQAKLSIYEGQIAFAIPNSARAIASIELCVRIAREVATEYGLGYHDPQKGVADY